MSSVTGRIAVAVAVVLAGGLLLVPRDTAPALLDPPAAHVIPLKPILTIQASRADREYFMSRHEVVPLGSSMLRVPILMYHYVRTPPSMRNDLLGYRLSVAPADFQAQMDWLYANHYHPVTFDQVRLYFSGLQPLPSRPVVITFDDGYRDLYTTAFPVLAAHGFSAVAYIVSGFVDRPEYVSHDELLQMDRAGIEIASHTVNHANLARIGPGLLAYELGQSKRWLEDLVAHPVLDFAYPSGKYNYQTVQAVAQAGYQTAVVEDGPSTHTLADRYTWGRVRVGGGESLGEFITNLGPSMQSVTVMSLDVEPS